MTYSKIPVDDLVPGDKAEIHQETRRIIRIRPGKPGELEILHASVTPSTSNCHYIHYAFMPETTQVWVIRN